MKTRIAMMIALFGLTVNAHAYSVDGYFIPDHIEKKVRDALTYIKKNAYNRNAGVAILREQKINEIQKLVDGLGPVDTAVANAYGVPSDLAKARKLNTSSKKEDRKELVNLADTYLEM